eukprot:TRINITY_DN1965_c0_g1_i2.p1 TRINITY_DN1965_c0_g1~~TRINITY_DN1965_c0_g1_i2.p1  ORF type:complete len:193 (-),score=14.21 TRINITY_DN1965_c0_g1_i2:270-848(-)
MEWPESLLNCADDIGCCILSFIFPPCVLAHARGQYDTSNCLFNALFVSGPMTRNTIREGMGVDGNCCSDILFMCVPILACLDVARIHRLTKKTMDRGLSSPLVSPAGGAVATSPAGVTPGYAPPAGQSDQPGAYPPAGQSDQPGAYPPAGQLGQPGAYPPPASAPPMTSVLCENCKCDKTQMRFCTATGQPH